MRSVFTTVFMTFTLMPVIAFAGQCEDRFAELLIDGNGEVAAKIHITQEIKGGATSTNWFYQNGTGDWMSEMIEPENMAWTMVRGNTMYSSADKGETWQKVRTMDSAGEADAARTARVENAKTIRDAVCGTQILNDEEYEKVEATYDHLQNFKTENRFTYWVDLDTGWITKAIYRMSGNGFESVSTQLIEKMDKVDLPVPE